MSAVNRILFIGGESSGKTSLCGVLSNIYNLPWVPEYGRQLFEEQNGILSFDDMLKIARGQVDREKVAMLTTRERYLLCDTSPLVTKFYSQAWFGKVDERLEALAQRQYDYVFLCARDFAFVNDGTRADHNFSLRQEQYYIQNFKQSFIVLSGSMEARVAMVRDTLL